METIVIFAVVYALLWLHDAVTEEKRPYMTVAQLRKELHENRMDGLNGGDL